MTEYGVDAMFYDFSENHYTVIVPPGLLYQSAWYYPRYDYLEFYMKTCGTSHIMLTSVPFDSDKASAYYEVLFGAGSEVEDQTEIWRNGELKVSCFHLYDL